MIDRERGLLGVVVGFMLWIRLSSAGNYFVDGELLLAGNDPWYHWRAALWSAHNWPRMLQFDPWTRFPTGTTVGQFGTPFDLLAGTAALVAGLGDPQAGMWAAAALPAVLGALVAVPVYLITRESYGRDAAIASAIALAMMTGSLLHRGSFGFLDHHIMEVLLQATVLYLVVRAIRSEAGRYGLAAGAAMLLYLMVWPPAVYFLAVLTVGLTAAALIAYLDGGEAWRGPVLAGRNTAAPAILAMPALADWSAVSVTAISKPHVAAAAGMGLGFVALGLILRADLPRRYVAAAVPVAGVAAAAASLGALGLLETATRWFGAGFVSRSTRGQTISEAQSVALADAPVYLFGEYGLLVLLAAAGLYMAARRLRPDDAVLGVWLIASLLMAMAQVRSNYYLAPAVAVLAGPPVAHAVDRLMVDIEPTRPEAARMLLVLLAVSAMALPAGGSLTAQTGPGDAADWTDTLDWMQSETPEPDMDYHGVYEPTDDFEYATYGVLSWWDYGHWITARAERVPVSNPFQQNARPSAEYFTAQNETEAEAALGALNASGGEEIRYVVVDDQMATSKFPAMATWVGHDHRTYFDNGAFSERYAGTMTADLYWGDAYGLEHHRLVYESPQQSRIAGVSRDGEAVQNPRPIGRATHEAVQSDPSLEYTFAQRESKVKVFERVDGATVSGETNASEVTLVLELRTSTQRRFSYVQTAEVQDGEWEATVPYWTEPTDGAVRAIGDYRVVADGQRIGTIEVAESDVRGE